MSNEVETAMPSILHPDKRSPQHGQNQTELLQTQSYRVLTTDGGGFKTLQDLGFKRQEQHTEYTRIQESSPSNLVYIKLSLLYFMHLECLQQELIDLEAQLDEVDLVRESRSSRLKAIGELSYSKSRQWLLKQIEQRLTKYDKMLLDMKSTRSSVFNRSRDYESNREFLFDKTFTHPGDLEISNDQWTRYGNDVMKIIRAPDAAAWLDGPLDPILARELRAQQTRRAQVSLSSKSQILLDISRRLFTQFGPILFWTAHITSALGYVLIANTSGPAGGSLANLLLVFWYMSTICIVVQEVRSKGFPYARKVILAGAAGCLAGFYILSVLMKNLTAASLTAVPTFFTVVLLIMRTM